MGWKWGGGNRSECGSGMGEIRAVGSSEAASTKGARTVWALSPVLGSGASLTNWSSKDLTHHSHTCCGACSATHCQPYWLLNPQEESHEH